MLSRQTISASSRSLRRLASSIAKPTAATTGVPTNIASESKSAQDAPQSPNYPSTWSANQRTRPGPASGPRFEQTVMSLQPQPLSAMELIANEPIRLVEGRTAVCDGGGGPLGHPKIFINLDKPGPRACGYCGIRFEQAPHHH